MSRGYSSRPTVVATAVVVAIGLSQLAHAQTPPAPQQTPRPQPTPTSSPTPPPFVSPFNKPRPGPGEADAFANLVALAEKYLTTVDASEYAGLCGTEADM